MFDFFQTALESISDFMDRGGPVLWLIALLLFVKWSMLFERLWFLNSVHKRNTAAALSEWEKRSDKNSWHAHGIR